MHDIMNPDEKNKEFMVHILNMPAYARTPEEAAQEIWAAIKSGDFDGLRITVTTEDGELCRQTIFVPTGYSPTAFHTKVNFNTEDWSNDDDYD